MIRIEALHVWYRTTAGKVHAVRGINIDVKHGQFYTLLGPSGCGKTTTLRSVAGLERPDEGQITIGDRAVYSSRTNTWVPPYERDISMVFQSYAIWPHMNVFDNVAFPLVEARKYSKKEIREKVDKALNLVQLDGLAHRPAPFLSGGQQQRLALARALAKEPSVLLLDEPLSNLDAKLREETRLELRELVKRLEITTLYVTHDQMEALTMADVVAVLNQGVIIQEASPMEIYQAPYDRFVANFIGLANFVDGRVVRVGENGSDRGEVETVGGMLRCVLPAGVAPGQQVVIVTRPEDVMICGQAGTTQDENCLEGRIEVVVFMGDSLDCQASVGSRLIRFRQHPSSKIARGDRVLLHLPAGSCRAIAE